MTKINMNDCKKVLKAIKFSRENKWRRVFMKIELERMEDPTITDEDVMSVLTQDVDMYDE